MHFGPPALYRTGESGWGARRPVGFVEGVFKSPLQLRFQRGCRLVGIRFKTPGLCPFVPSPMSQFTDQFIDLADVFLQPGAELIERVAETTSDESLPVLLDRFLLRHMNHVDADHRLQQAIRILTKQEGMVPVHRICKETSISERQLERLFDRQVGISPERFAQRLRLSRFVRLAQERNHPSFTQLAYECGFADQSHLIRTFKQHLDLTPREYFSQVHPIQQALNQ